MPLLEEWRRWLAGVGEDPDREGLVDTPRRLRSMLEDMVLPPSSLPDDPLATTFAVAGYDDWVCLDRIPFGSLCEHHLLPFFGHISLAYWPAAGRVVGLSKLVRLAEQLSRRLTLQERLTVQLAEAIFSGLRPRAAAVRVEAEHQCMGLRGVRIPNLRTTTFHRIGDAPRWPFP
ncbi:MAG: GTP cyclohydrolase I FolE [Puniceicoccales bacterium]|jgi:GTP cyclohydrolase I|nr:GTP cyclohydrolase I FolE [Puniceicoccales bacterium]